VIGELTLADLVRETPPSVDLIIERIGDVVKIRAGVRRDVRG